MRPIIAASIMPALKKALASSGKNNILTTQNFHRSAILVEYPEI
jgi:hypothetical protein